MTHFPGSPDKTRDTLLVPILHHHLVFSPQPLTATHSLPKLSLKPWIRPDPPSLILRNARVIDPAQSALLPGLQDVVIENGLVLSVTAAGTESRLSGTPKDPPLVSVDLGGKFLCPYVGQ